MTIREPEWTEQDRAEVLALALYRASLCPCGCGFPLSDTTSHEEDGPQFSATRTVCRARLAQIEAIRATDEGKPPSPTAAARLWTTQMRR